MSITRQEIDAMYMDLFGRPARDAGAQYWMDEVASGKIEASDLPRHLAYAANTTETGRADLAYGTRLREQAEAQAAAEAAAAEEREAQRLAEVERQEQMLSLMREQQAAQLLAQQRLQDQISMGIQGKGGTQQQAPQSVFGDSAPTQQPAQEPTMYDDIDSGGGYYRNPYASGYGMGYQDPYAGMRYMPQGGLMGPSGFGGKGGYASPMYSPYQYSPYGGMSPGKGGYGSTQYRGVPPGATPTGPGYSEPITAGGAEMYADAPVPPPVELDPLAEPTTPLVADPTEQMEGVQTSPDVPVEAAPPMEGGPRDYLVEDVFPVVDQSGPTPNVMQTYQSMYRPMYRPMYPMYGGKGGYYR